MPLQKKQASMRKNPKRRAVWWPAKEKVVRFARFINSQFNDDIDTDIVRAKRFSLLKRARKPIEQKTARTIRRCDPLLHDSNDEAIRV